MSSVDGAGEAARTPGSSWRLADGEWSEDVVATTPLRALLAEAVAADAIAADATDASTLRWYGGASKAHRDVECDGYWYDVKRAFWCGPARSRLGFGGLRDTARADYLALVVTDETSDLATKLAHADDGSVALHAVLRPEALYVVPVHEACRLARRESLARWTFAPAELAPWRRRGAAPPTT